MGWPRTFDEVGGGGPPTDGGERHGLILGERVRQAPNQFGEAEGPVVAGRDPVGGAGDEGEPVGGGAPDDDAVDGVL